MSEHFAIAGVPSFAEIAKHWSECPGAPSAETIRNTLYRALMRGQFMDGERSCTVVVRKPEDRPVPEGWMRFSGEPLLGTCRFQIELREPRPFIQIAAKMEGIGTPIFDPRPIKGRRILEWLVVPPGGDPIRPVDLSAHAAEEAQRSIQWAQSDGEEPTRPVSKPTDEFMLVPLPPQLVAEQMRDVAINVPDRDAEGRLLASVSLPKSLEGFARLNFDDLPKNVRKYCVEVLRIRCEDLASWYEAHGVLLNWPCPRWLRQGVDEQLTALSVNVVVQDRNPNASSRFWSIGQCVHWIVFRTFPEDEEQITHTRLALTGCGKRLCCGGLS